VLFRSPIRDSAFGSSPSIEAGEDSSVALIQCSRSAAQRLAAVLRPEAFQDKLTGALPQRGKERAPNDHLTSEAEAFTVAVMYQRLVGWRPLRLASELCVWELNAKVDAL